MRSINILLSLCALLGCAEAVAVPIGRAKAGQLARQFVRLDEASELRAAELDQQGGAIAAYHIFNDRDGRGFVIISGDDEFAPVLGYSDRGRLDTQRLPEQLLGLLEQHRGRMEALRSARLTPGEPTPTPRPNARAVRGPLLRSLWNQDEPFNNLTPTIGGRHTASGCVATAMAQMMYFHRWPLRGKGGQTYTPQHPDIGQLSVDFAQSVYQWDRMLAEYAYDWVFVGNGEQRRPSWTNEQAEAVAKLMLDIGVSVRTGYNLAASGGSGSNMFDAARSLREHFSYQTQSHYRDNVPHRSFLNIIRQELDEGYPILVAGSHAYAGHAWVIDGYDENGFLHVNWGWGGLSNGYFALSFMSPDKVGTGGDIGGYNQGQMIILIRPDREGAARFPDYGPRFSFIAPSCGLRLDAQHTDATARKLGVHIERLGNRRSEPLSGQVALSLRNAQGQELRLVRVSEPLPELQRDKVHSRLSVVVDVPEGLLDGEYSLHTVCRPASAGGDASWVGVEYDVPLTFSLRGGAVALPEYSSSSEVELAMTQAPQLLTPLWQGGEATLQLGIKNRTHHATFFGEIVMNLRRDGQEVAQIPVAQYQFFDYSQYDALSSISSVMPRQLEPGIYEADFSFRVPGYGGAGSVGKVLRVQNPFGQFRIEVLARAGRAVLELAPDSYSPSGQTNSCTLSLDGEIWSGEALSLEMLDQKSLAINCILINNGETAFDGRISCELRDLQTGVFYPLTSRDGVRLNEAALGAFAEVQLSVPRSAFDAVPKGRRYVLYLQAEQGGRKYDVWAQGVYRRSFVLTATEQEAHTTAATALPSGSALRCYPNPATSSTLVRGITFGTQVQLFALTGRLVLSQTATSPDGLRLDVGHLPRGLYLLRSGGRSARLLLR